MNSLRRRHFRVICALLVLFVLSGDLVSDAIHDASGACASESQSGGHACPACGCTIHAGNALASESVALLGSAWMTVASILSLDDDPVAGAAPAIDHPPQLA